MGKQTKWQGTKTYRSLIQGCFLLLTGFLLVNFLPSRPFMLTTLGLVLLITLLFHTGFCGWLCPLGTMTDLVRALGKKIGGLSFLKPTNEKYLLWVKANKKLLNKIDGPARYIKYILLVWIFQAAFFSFGSIKEERQHGIFSVLQLVIALLVLGLFVDRAWYRYGCPLG